MKRALMSVLVTLMVGVGAQMLAPTPVFAAVDCETPFLTFRPWYTGLVVRGSVRPDCPLKEVNAEGVNDATNVDLSVFIWTVILNILSMLFSLVGYLALGFMILGGYYYVLARGDPSKIARGKMTLIRAVIGLVICILASLIVNTIVGVMTGAVGA